METLQIQPNDNLSINDLTLLQEQGFSVLRSAHVGNLSPYNLSLAEAGIPLLLVDHNVTGVDTNYFPEFILTQGAQTRIAEDGTVASRTLTSNGRFLDTVHVESIKEALPSAMVFTNTEYLRQNELVAGEITTLAAEYFPEEFTRISQSDGTTNRRDDAAELLRTLGVMQLNDDPRAERSALLIPNMVNIMTNFVVEAMSTERDTQFHVSGPDMIVYMKDTNRLAEFKRFYELIKTKASFGRQLPKNLIIQLVPASSARFATTNEERPELEGLFIQLEASDIALRALATRKKAFFTSEKKNDKELKRAFELQSGQEQAASDKALIEQAEKVTGLFVAPKKEIGFVTQYDLLEQGGLFVASQNRELSFSALTALTKRLVDLRKKRTP